MENEKAARPYLKKYRQNISYSTGNVVKDVSMRYAYRSGKD